MQAKAAPGFARPSWYVLADLLAAIGGAGNYSLASDVFAALAASRGDFAGMSYDTLALTGAVVRSGAGARERPHDDRRAAASRTAVSPSRTACEHLPPPESGMAWFIATIVKMLLIFTIYMIGVMIVIWAERRICAFIQDRRGPNRVGPHGLLQSVADGVKNIMKEETYPGAGVSAALRSRAGDVVHSRAAHLGGDPVRRAVGLEVGHDRHGARAAADRLPVHPLDRVARRVRHRARRLVVEQQVRAARRPALERADDLVRDLDGDVDDPGAHPGRQRLAEPHRGSSRAGGGCIGT